ncbi:putative folate/biopterin transporter [Trypanosoma grayi]|uniref:putative folate/biopterin transporter n=1 Tax=Trypanosoma grayi TaxID=71804 RepID=UPI0004F4657B|nr:putative folate/biopterin transporter [Trypanosoma grayi]KEG12914.1 putative folate/biopterin transporter [Trypanosoma grayi]
MKGEKSDALVERAMSMGIDCDADTLEQLRQVPLLHLTQLMSTHLTDEKHVVSALLVLARATTGRDCLTDEEAVVILRFFTGKLTSLPNVEAAVESISLVVEDLSTQRSCTKMLFDVLSDGFLRNVGFQALPTKIRRCGYKIFMFMVTKKTMPWLATPFLRLLLNALDGESEPELVMHALDLQYLISRCVDKDVMEPLLEDYFDSLSSYFPVVFSQPPECPVTRDDLKRALTRCMTCPLYVDLCVSFLLSRLPSPSSVVKQESIEVFLELFSPNSRHSMDELKPHLLSVVSHVRNEVVRAVSVGCGDSDAFLQGCMKLLGFIAKRTHDTSYTSILSWLEPITSGTLASLNSGRVVCSAYATMLYHLASSDVCCSTSLARYFLPLLLMNVQQEIESDVDDSLLILSALLTGFFDLGNASGSLNGSIPKDVMRESLQVGSSGLFEFAEKKVLELLDRAEPPSVFIKCEFLSSLLSLAAYLCPWMPDEIVQVSCKRLVSICLCGDQNISEKVANCISRIGRVQGDILKDVLLNAIDDVEPGVTGVFALYQGLLSSSVSTAVTAMEILLIPSKTSFADRLPEANVFSLCLHGLSEHEDISGETALRLLTLLVQRDSVESFELICELLLRIPITLHGTTLLQMIDEKRWGILMTALLSCCESDILHVAESTEHWVAELLTGVCQKNLQCLAMQGVSALCARVPSVSDAFLERSKCCDPAAALALYAATARGLLVAGEVMNDKVEQITERLIGAVCEGIDADDALVATFFFPSHGSKRSISLLVPLTLSARKSGAPLPLKLIRILVLLIKKEASVLNFDWNGVLEICSKVARQERTEDIVVGIVELLDSIFSRIDSKIFFMRLLVMDGNLFHLIQSGVRSSALRTRCTSLSLLSQVALSAVQLSTQGSGDEYSHREEVMRLKGDVLHVVQPALNDHKRLARRAAAYCANQWYKLK